MTPDRHDEAGFLTLRVGGGTGRPERLMVIRPPANGVVQVRQWSSHSLNTAGEELVLRCEDLLTDIEHAWEARWPVSEEIGRVRRWLAG